MLFMPPGAPLGYREFLGRGLGEKAVRNSMRELEVAGYRWRFQTRTREGTLRTATLVFEEPVPTSEAWSTVAELSSNRVEQCLSSRADGEHNPLSDRADSGAARSDKGKHADFLDDVIGETPSGTVQRSTAARCTAARSAVPRSVAAQPYGFKEPYGSPPDQTEPVREPVTVAGGEGVVGSGLEGLLDHDPEGVAGEDWAVLVECLPPAMRMIEPAAVSAVAAALRQRTTAGWSPDALRATLAGNALPSESEIRSLAGIVSYRIGQIPVRPPRPRKRSTTQAVTVIEEPVERALASRMRQEARAAGDQDADKPFTWWLEKYPPGDGSASESGLGAAS